MDTTAAQTESASRSRPIWFKGFGRAFTCQGRASAGAYMSEVAENLLDLAQCLMTQRALNQNIKAVLI